MSTLWGMKQTLGDKQGTTLQQWLTIICLSLLGLSGIALAQVMLCEDNGDYIADFYDHCIYYRCVVNPADKLFFIYKMPCPPGTRVRSEFLKLGTLHDEAPCAMRRKRSTRRRPDPCERHAWSAWMNMDQGDEVGGEDNELYDRLETKPSPCAPNKPPIAAECRRRVDYMDSTETGQYFAIPCSSQGLLCIDDHNLLTINKTCDDYEVRFYCPLVWPEGQELLRQNDLVGQEPSVLTGNGPDVDPNADGATAGVAQGEKIRTKLTGGGQQEAG